MSKFYPSKSNLRGVQSSAQPSPLEQGGGAEKVPPTMYGRLIALQAALVRINGLQRLLEAQLERQDQPNVPIVPGATPPQVALGEAQIIQFPMPSTNEPSQADRAAAARQALEEAA